MAGSGTHRRHAVGYRAAGVVVAMDADDHVVTNVAMHGANDGLNLVWQRTAVGVAQHKVARTLDDCGFERTQCELGVGLVAIEEVLHIDEHASSVANEKLNRIGDHRSALFEGCLQRVEHVIVPTLGNDAHGRCARIDEVAQSRIVVDLAGRTTRRAKRHHRARAQGELGCGASEELNVFGVGAWPAALDVVHAQEVELFGDTQLVFHRGRHALYLQAIAQGGVEHLN